MPGRYPAQGTVVTFGGVNIGFLTGFDVQAKSGQLYDKTNVSSPIVGTGANSRILREYDCTSIEPPTIQITFWGPPSYSATDAGLKAAIVFDAPGDEIYGQAILTEWNHQGRVGQWTTGSATFQLTGNLTGPPT